MLTFSLRAGPKGLKVPKYRVSMAPALGIVLVIEVYTSYLGTWTLRATLPQNKQQLADHLNLRILTMMISGIPLTLGIRTRMWDPCTHNYMSITYHL